MGLVSGGDYVRARKDGDARERVRIVAPLLLQVMVVRASYRRVL